MEIILDGKLLQMYECTAYLGVELSYNISWSPYILKLCGKLAQKVAILRRIKKRFLSPHYVSYITLLYNHI